MRSSQPIRRRGRADADGAAWCLEVEEFFDLETSLDDDAAPQRLALATTALALCPPALVGAPLTETFVAAVRDLLDQTQDRRDLQAAYDATVAALVATLMTHGELAAYLEAASRVRADEWHAEIYLKAQWRLAWRQADGTLLEQLRPRLEAVAADDAEASVLLASYARTIGDFAPAPAGSASEWHAVLMNAMLTKDFLPLVRYGETVRANAASERLLTYLYLAALSPAGLRRRLQTPKNTRRMFAAAIAADPAQDQLAAAAEIVEQLFETGAPAAAQRRRLLALWAMTTTARDPELQLVTAAAGAVLAHQFGTAPLTRAFRQRYGTLAAALSAGKQGDPLGLLESFATDALGSRTGRSALATASKVGLLIATDRLKRLFSAADDHERRSRVLLGETIDAVTATLGQTHGLLQKFLQMSEVFSEFLPPEVLERVNLTRSVARGMNDEHVRAALARAHGERSPFAVFNDRPFACGSFGQVHAATLSDGRNVAVKIRYPDAAAKLREDFGKMRALAPLMHSFAGHVPWAKVFDGWRDLYEAECDYRIEARNTRLLRQLLLDAGVGGLIIPEVLDELSNDTVLVQQFCPGVSFETFAANASQTERDRVGQNLMQAVLILMERGHFSYDLHPDNFHFDGTAVYWLDHGGIISYDAPIGILTVIKTLIANDEAKFVQTVGTFAAEKANARDLMALFREIFAPLVVDAPFTFTPAVAENVVKRLFLATRARQLTVPTDGSMVNIRFFVSLYNLLGRLRAGGRWGAGFH